MSRWFYQYAINYRTYNVFETSEYSADQGYATKKEAISAAVDHVNKEMKLLTSAMDYNIQKLIDISSERKRLEGMLNGI